MGFLRPGLDLLELAELLAVEADVHELAAGLLEAVHAKVVVDALDQRPGELARHDLGKPGQVLLDDLLLERDVGGADHDAGVGRDRMLDGGDQVGVGLADPAGRFDGQVALLRDRAVDRLGHLDLARADLVVARFLLEEPPGAEVPADHGDVIPQNGRFAKVSGPLGTPDDFHAQERRELRRDLVGVVLPVAGAQSDAAASLERWWRARP